MLVTLLSVAFFYVVDFISLVLDCLVAISIIANRLMAILGSLSISPASSSNELYLIRVGLIVENSGLAAIIGLQVAVPHCKLVAYSFQRSYRRNSVA